MARVRHLPLPFRAEQLPRRLFGYRRSDVLRRASAMEARDRAADRAWRVIHARAEAELRSVAERLALLEATLAEERARAATAEVRLARARENSRWLRVGAHGEVQSLQPGREARLNTLRQQILGIVAATEGVDRRLQTLISAVSAAAAAAGAGEPGFAGQQDAASARGTPGLSPDAAQDLLAGWVGRGEFRVAAANLPRRIQTRSGRVLGRMAAVVLSGVPPRIVGVDCERDGQPTGFVPLEDIRIVSDDTIVVDADFLWAPRSGADAAARAVPAGSSPRGEDPAPVGVGAAAAAGGLVRGAADAPSPVAVPSPATLPPAGARSEGKAAASPPRGAEALTPPHSPVEAPEAPEAALSVVAAGAESPIAAQRGSLSRTAPAGSGDVLPPPAAGLADTGVSNPGRETARVPADAAPDVPRAPAEAVADPAPGAAGARSAGAGSVPAVVAAGAKPDEPAAAMAPPASVPVPPPPGSAGSPLPGGAVPPREGAMGSIARNGGAGVDLAAAAQFGERRARLGAPPAAGAGAGPSLGAAAPPPLRAPAPEDATTAGDGAAGRSGGAAMAPLPPPDWSEALPELAVGHQDPAQAAAAPDVQPAAAAPGAGAGPAAVAEPAPSGPVSATAGYAAPTGEGPVQARAGLGTEVLAFLMGKVVGLELRDAQNRLIAERGRRIDTQLVAAAEAAGCLPELIVHMELAPR